VPFVNPVWLQYMSHKVGRLLVPWALVGTLVSSAVLATSGPIYALAFAAQAVFYGLALIGAWLDSRDRGLMSADAPFGGKLSMSIGKEAR
jgi:poly-beta-1,6-N-acetyl-D-glucosamine synthase